MNQATIDGSIRTTGHQPATGGGWREAIIVLAMVLAPVGLAVILTTAGVLAYVGWTLAHGDYPDVPSWRTLRPAGMLAYVVSGWLAIAAAWIWSRRRGLHREVFLFRRLTSPATAASLAGLATALYGVPAATHLLSRVTGGAGPGGGIDLHNPYMIATYLLLFVVTSPLCEEILYRGLLVTWLRRIGWRDPAILLVGSLIFGANHAIPLGLVWSIVMVAFGAILFALRLRYDSLTPAWLTHMLFNAQPFLILPLIDRFAPGLHPGYIS